jgi:hypothetical protein
LGTLEETNRLDEANALFLVALSMLANAFGILAPDKATALRDQFTAFFEFPV